MAPRFGSGTVYHVRMASKIVGSATTTNGARQPHDGPGGMDRRRVLGFGETAAAGECDGFGVLTAIEQESGLGGER